MNPKKEARVWMSHDGPWGRVINLAEDLKIQSPRIFDLQIALTALENGATEIWTHDRWFLTFAGLTLHDPL